MFEEEDLGKVYDPRLMRRLLEYAVPYWPLLALCLALLLAVAALGLLGPFIVKIAIDEHLTGPGGSRQGLLLLAGTYVGLVALSGILQYGQSLLIQGVGQHIMQTVRQDVFGHLQRLSLSYFDRNPVGRLVTRVANDTETLNEMYTSVLVNLFRDVFVIAGTMAVMLRLDWRLALVGMIVLPAIAACTFTFQRLFRAAWRVVRIKLARVNATLAENLSGMRLVQAFAREQRQLAEFHATNDELYRASWQQLRIAAMFRPLIDLLAQLALAALLWYGGLRALGGEIGLGTLYLFTSYLRQLYSPIGELTEKFNILQAAMASGERLVQLLDTPPEVEDPPVPALLPAAVSAGAPARGRIAFRAVSFAYHGEDWVLRDVELAAEPGQTVGFVGHTGAGKSTILNLVARFYDATHGQILLDGVDVRALPQGDLRHALGIVLQEPFLFTGSVADNIRLGGAMTDDEVEAVLVQAGGRHLLERLRDGVRTVVSERGSSLSTGERQLVCLARALARDPAILLLDEATASVDSHTEQSINTALAARGGRRTTLIVAHRLATIQHADTIVVLHKGRIREVGNHRDLMAQQGLYYKLWRLQSAAEPISG